MQVLKDAATRAVYDKHLQAQARGRFQVAVSSEVRRVACRAGPSTCSMHVGRGRNQQLPGGTAQAAWCMQVDLGDMEVVAENGTSFTHPCRCGGRYLVEAADLSLSDSEVLVQCQTCSLVIRVLYSVEG